MKSTITESINNLLVTSSFSLSCYSYLLLPYTHSNGELVCIITTQGKYIKFTNIGKSSYINVSLR